MTQKFIAAMTGYKATNADMTCKGHKFELGRWYEVPEVKMCEKGFHFCVHPSGVYSYYTSADVRVFRCEAEHILEVPTEAGADFKPVAKRIRLVEEVTPGSKTKSNTGDWNTGDWNTGDWNTGDRNTGNGNTGNGNTGNRNTGNGNATNYSSGFFCVSERTVFSFDVQTEFTRQNFLDNFPEVHRLCELLKKTDKIVFSDFKNIPGITPAKLLKLHKKHLAAQEAQ